MKTRVLFFPLLILLILLIFPLKTISAAPRIASYTVNSNADAPDANLGDGICAAAGGNCTLHAAIENANQDGQTSIIQFASKFQDTNAINDDSLPILTENNTTIDASNRWDTSNDRPGVEVECTVCDDILRINSNGNLVKGILFAGGQSGVNLFNGNNNVIGGTGTGERNVFITGKYGVYLASGLYNSVVNNYIGTIDGETVPGSVAGDVGIWAIADYTTITNNLIVGYTGLPASIINPPSGIYLDNSDDNLISDNVIGVNVWQDSALGNEVGIFLSWSDNNTIGPNNLIEGNTSHGIELYQSKDVTITTNQIGKYLYSIGNGGDGIHLHAVDNTTLIEDNDLCYNGGHGLWLDFFDAAIEGNLIAYNSSDGIFLSGDYSVIGGTTADDRNVIGDNGGSGIHLSDTHDVAVINNYIGLRWEGAYDFGNTSHGILIDNGSYDNVIGSSSAGEENWIAYNGEYGILISGEYTHNNEVYGNVIGAPITWDWEAGNGKHGIGIYGGAHHNSIGSQSSGGGNIILDSGWSGLVIQNGTGNIIEGNFIGTDGGNHDWGNAYYGVVVEYTSGNTAQNNQINFNEIAYNGMHNGVDSAEAGVYINWSDGNMISRNSIYSNDGLGIKLVNGGNNDMPAPVIVTASCEGTISGTAAANAWIQIFSDNADEGKTWEGTTQANGSGSWSWPGGVAGPYLTATARDNSTLDTSAFSTPYAVGTCNVNTYIPLFMKE